jgi:hypothetical protein
MSGYYPAGVTGCEPQIIGDGLEDKCVRCVEKADEEMTASQIPDATTEREGGTG